LLLKIVYWTVLAFMKLARFKRFAAQVARDSVLCRATAQIEIYRSTGTDWFSTDDVKIEDTQLISVLGRTNYRQTHWRPRNSTVSYFPLSDIDAIVVATFPAATQVHTRNTFFSNLQTRLTASNNEYDATHDHLTGLLNRNEFDRLISSGLSASQDDTNVERLGHSGPSDVVALLSIDIDNFKNVNDMFGHQYGDLILCCLALRLEKLAATVLNEESQRLRVFVGRPGGEEFALGICGSLSPGEELDIAEKILFAVEGRATPDEEEWSLLRDSTVPAAMDLPHVSDRRITISVGISEAKTGSAPEEVPLALARLKSNADTALYRAKNAGRNQAVNYNAILAKYGKILEHHPGTDIVAIDIGRNVALRPGQEFMVYHPQFSGDAAFIFQDGRSKRRLGAYPRLSCGRVEVFDVQAEISFARVVSNDLKSDFPPGSNLEAVPAGSISHLLPRRDVIIDELLTQIELETYTSAVVKAAKFPICYVLALTNFLQLIEENGPSFVNKALVGLFVRLKAQFGGAARLGQIAPDQLACVSEDGGVVNDQTIRLAMDSVFEEFGRKPKFASGAVVEADLVGRFEENRREALSAASLKLARYAVVASQSQGADILHFNAETPQAVILQSRRARATERARIDYGSFSELGLDNALVENQMALMYLEAELFDQAKTHINLALAIENRHIFMANAAAIEFRLGNYGNSLEIFKEALLKHPQAKLGNYYQSLLARAFVGYVNSGARDAVDSELIKMAQSVSVSEEVNISHRLRLRSALSQLTRTGAAD
jgi:diguanylate cyclase (GGDEF)-like protein